ncbi:MAG: ankyrin repeat domain-containing protein [Arcobacteraceae bacterium]|jgi:ankyrin repeat protein|nr:ankyrin repeat domain-containing protein [Arcobacteraceae bacterium]
MIQSLFGRFIVTPELFVKELFKKVIDEVALENILSSKKFSINHQNENGETFLHLCILHSKFKSAKWLIEKGNIDVTIKDYLGQEPIVIAIKKNNHLIVELILKAKQIDINQVDIDGRSLLQNAVLSGNEEIANELIHNFIDVNIVDKNNRNVMFDAIAYGSDQIINKLLTTDINLNQQDKDGETILHKQETLQNEELCVKLLEKGANPTICDKEGKNFLFHIATRGIEGGRLLDIAIQHGSNINAKVRNNNTILMETMLAFYNIPLHEKERRLSLLKMAENLVLKGIDINAINNDGESGLFDAIRNNDYNICAFFINKRVNLNIQNKNYQTPMLLAVLSGIKSIDIILLLLKNGANPSIKNDDGKDLLEILNELILYTHEFRELEDKSLEMYAKKENQFFVVLKEILKNSNYNLQNLNSKGQPLFFAPMLDGYYDLFKLYITNKFDINALDSNNLNIFYLYVYAVFSLNTFFDAFRPNLIGMLGYGADINLVDAEGRTVISKIMKHNTNAKLFEILIEVARFKYEARDKQGRTLCHHAVLNKNLEIVKMIYVKNHDVLNISDGYGILPITYAALLGSFDIVEELLRYGTIYIKSNKSIPVAVRIKFATMVKNIDTLKTKTTDKDLLRKVGILTDQIKSDFKVTE